MWGGPCLMNIGCVISLFLFFLLFWLILYFGALIFNILALSFRRSDLDPNERFCKSGNHLLSVSNVSFDHFLNSLPPTRFFGSLFWEDIFLTTFFYTMCIVILTFGGPSSRGHLCAVVSIVLGLHCSEMSSGSIAAVSCSPVPYRLGVGGIGIGVDGQAGPFMGWCM